MFDKSFVRKRMRVTLALPALLSFSWRDVLACLSVLVPPTPMITQDCRRIEPGLFGGTVPPSSDFLHAAGPFHLEQGSPCHSYPLISASLCALCFPLPVSLAQREAPRGGSPTCTSMPASVESSFPLTPSSLSPPRLRHSDSPYPSSRPYSHPYPATVRRRTFDKCKIKHRTQPPTGPGHFLALARGRQVRGHGDGEGPAPGALWPQVQWGAKATRPAALIPRGGGLDLEPGNPRGYRYAERC